MILYKTLRIREMIDVPKKHKDEITLSYFDKNTPNYTARRYKSVIGFINQQKKENCSLIDVGCGDGTVLNMFKTKTNISTFLGLDISKNYLRLVKERIGCDTFHGSILDDMVIKKINKKFDYVIIGAMLHHLIGESRDESKLWANKALQNAFSLLSFGGHLIILEPIYSPKGSMDIVFNIKKFITKFTVNRLNILKYDNNIGAPVVSYYDKETLIRLMKDCTSEKPIFERYISRNILLSMKLIGVKNRGELLLIYKK